MCRRHSAFRRSICRTRSCDGQLFFTAEDRFGRELWVSDGTQEATRIVKDLGDDDGYYGQHSRPWDLTNVNGTLFFTARTQEHGRELWRSDGSAAGTAEVADINPGPANAATKLTLMPGFRYPTPDNLFNLNGTLYFTPDDGIHGHELWTLEPEPGDSNYDGAVDVADLNNVRRNFGRTSDNLPGDVNGDDRVDIKDLNEVRNHFGGVPTADRSLTADRKSIAAAQSLAHHQATRMTDDARDARDAVFAAMTDTSAPSDSLKRSAGQFVKGKRLAFRVARS